MHPLSFDMSLGSAILLIWIIIHCPFSTACLQDERSYLLDFKDGLNLSPGWLSSWRPGLNCCEWEGVACDYHTSHVIRLELHTGSRTREIRSSLFDLQHLQHLDLSGNDFGGISIPPQLSKLQRLTFLSLSSGGFGGEVPLELGNMSSLRHLDISYISKSSKFDVWVRKLRSLEFLKMSYADLRMASEHWGEALSGLHNLSYVDLTACMLSGKIPDLSNLTHLSHLDLSQNSFPFELPSWFENVSSLVSLSLPYCNINGSIPSNFMSRSRMSTLVLAYNGDLKGNLSFILSHSSSLVDLNLSGCRLGGVLPHSNANFSKIRTMRLSTNNFEGTIPYSFGSISSLRLLDLSYNRLTGHIPLSLCQLMKLRDLYLDHNQLSGTVSDSISNLANLEGLSLSSNRLKGNFSLQVLENLTRLQDLQLSENQLIIDISTSWVPPFSNLVLLGLGSCNIEGDFPAFLSQQYFLEELDLSDNNIVGNLPLWLWDLTYLRWLNLSTNQLEGCLPPKISQSFLMVDLHGNRLYGSLPALVSEILDLSDNGFNGSIPATIGKSHSLSLSGNNLTGQIPSSICNNSDGYTYGIVDLSKNKLIGTIPKSIGSCYALSVLNLAQNFLQGEIPEELGHMSLRTLNLNGNKLQGIVPSTFSDCEFSDCEDLQVLDLGSNELEGSIPLWIDTLKGLRILSLASNKFTGRIPPQLFSMQNLQILDLSSNQLSGSIPSNVSMLYVMLNKSQSFDVQHSQSICTSYYTETNCALSYVDEVTVWTKGRAALYPKIVGAHKFIDLSHNKLSGNIPLELGFLKGLLSLNLSKNYLSGPIPESLGGMFYLESMDLSKNKLSGRIPFQLLNLTFLEVLNLSYNMLSGLIPQGKQFSTFEASSFLGNPHLHGTQLENGRSSFGLGNTKNHNNTIGEDGDVDANVMDRWWAVGMGLCYGIGFSIVISVLCFHIKWRYICFSRMDSFIYYVLE